MTNKIDAVELLAQNPWLSNLREAQKLIDALVCDPANAVEIDWEND